MGFDLDNEELFFTRISNSCYTDAQLEDYIRQFSIMAKDSKTPKEEKSYLRRIEIIKGILKDK